MNEKTQGYGVRQVHVFMDDGLKRRIRRESEALDMSMSSFMRMCAAYYFDAVIDKDQAN